MQPRVILAVRHPDEVIRSIEERNMIAPRTTELLWLRSLLEAEQASRSCIRVWTCFDSLLDDWETTAQRIADGLGLSWPNEPENVAGRIADILRPRHRHHRVTNGAASSSLSSLTIRAWQAVEHALAGDEAAARTVFDEIHAGH
jgi:hypothetical protein